MEIGIQFWPWQRISELLEFARLALKSYQFDQIWYCDEYQYTDTLTLLSAMAGRFDVKLGTMVTWPNRNPLDLAQRFGTIQELMGNKELSIGLGAGGAVQTVLAEPTSSLSVMEETIVLLRSLLQGEIVSLKSFPNVSGRFHLNSDVTARLYSPPELVPPIYVGLGGPRMMQIAGRLGDGAIFNGFNPYSSPIAIAHGLFKEAFDIVEKSRRDSSHTNKFKRIFKLNFSISRNGRRAREWAKRNTSYALAQYYTNRVHLGVLKRSGLDTLQILPIWKGYAQGLGIDDASALVSDELLDKSGFIIAGTAEDVVERCKPLLAQLKQFDFDQLVLGVPLGPDIPEALDLLTRQVIPIILESW